MLACESVSLYNCFISNNFFKIIQLKTANTHSAIDPSCRIVVQEHTKKDLYILKKGNICALLRTDSFASF